jgi:hypothetical protein
MSFQSRPLADLADDLDGVHGHVARVGGLLSGLALLFGGLAGLTVLVGVWTREPLFAMSAGLALTAAAAFGLSAQSLSRAAAQTPRIRAALVTLPVKTWRRAA